MYSIIGETYVITKLSFSDLLTCHFWSRVTRKKKERTMEKKVKSKQHCFEDTTELNDLYITVNIKCRNKSHVIKKFNLLILKTDSYNRIQCLVTLPLHSYPNFGFFLMKKRSQQNKMPPLNHFEHFVSRL